MVDRYECNEFAPPIEAANKIAFALKVSLDNLKGESLINGLDTKNIRRFKDLQQLEYHKKKTLFDLIETK